MQRFAIIARCKESVSTRSLVSGVAFNATASATEYRVLSMLLAVQLSSKVQVQAPFVTLSGKMTPLNCCKGVVDE